MPRKRGGPYKRAPKIDPDDHLSIEERALLKALGVDAVRPDLVRKIKAESPFLGVEERAPKIKALIEQDSDLALVDLRVRVPVAAMQKIEEIARMQDMTITATANRLILLGADRVGAIFDREKIESAVRRLILEILLPSPSFAANEEENDDPFANVDPRMLGRGLASQLIRAKKRDE